MDPLISVTPRNSYAYLSWCPFWCPLSLDRAPLRMASWWCESKKRIALGCPGQSRRRLLALDASCRPTVMVWMPELRQEQVEDRLRSMAGGASLQRCVWGFVAGLVLLAGG